MSDVEPYSAEELDAMSAYGFEPEPAEPSPEDRLQGLRDLEEAARQDREVRRMAGEMVAPLSSAMRQELTVQKLGLLQQIDERDNADYEALEAEDNALDALIEKHNSGDVFSQKERQRWMAALLDGEIEVE